MPGYHHLFIPGPTNVPEAVRRAVDAPMENMRSPDFPGFVKPLLQDLKQVFRTRDARVFIFPGSGTGGWEAALTNTLSPGDKVLAARHGQFSHLWIEMCRGLGLEVEVVECSWRQGAPEETFAEILAADTAHEIKAVLVCQNETTTGVTSSVPGVRGALDAAAHPALLMVDGVSSIASLEFRMDDWGVDLAVTGSQKGFMMPTGLAIVAVSEKAMQARETAKMRRFYYDFGWMSMSHETGYFPYTPASNLLRGLRASVDLLLAEGLDNVHARHRHLADGVRAAVAAWGLELCAESPRWHSDTVTAILLPEGVDGNALVRHAHERYDVSLGGGLSEVAGKVFRIGHLGSVNEVMMLSALAASEIALRDFGVALQPGSGVGAAMEIYRNGAAVQSLAVAAE